MEQIRFSVDRCVICDGVVEEGRWVCVACEKKWGGIPKDFKPVRPERGKPGKRRWFGWLKRK